MARCRGKTKSGARCKRNAAGDSQYCYVHEPSVAEPKGRAEEEIAAAGIADEESKERPPRSEPRPAWDGAPEWVPLALGIVVTVGMLWLLKRAPRLPGSFGG